MIKKCFNCQKDQPTKNMLWAGDYHNICQRCKDNIDKETPVTTTFVDPKSLKKRPQKPKGRYLPTTTYRYKPQNEQLVGPRRIPNDAWFTDG